MILSRRIREMAAVAVLATCSLLVLHANSRTPTELNWMDRAVLRISAPIQSLLSGAARGIGDVWRGYVFLVDVKAENGRLVEENRRLRAELEREAVEAGRQAQLERLLSLRAEVPSETIAARVVGVETTPFYRILRVRLDRGVGEVKPGMVVVVPEGIVGRVNRVYGQWSDVLLAADPESAIDVQVVRTGARGVLKGVSGERGYRAHIPEMPRGEDTREGDEVITSGIGGFPRGLPVGAVTRVTRPDAGLWQEVEVTPAVDFARLREVLVVLSPPPPADPDAGKRGLEPHRGLQVPR